MLSCIYIWTKSFDLIIDTSIQYFRSCDLNNLRVSNCARFCSSRSSTGWPVIYKLEELTGETKEEDHQRLTMMITIQQKKTLHQVASQVNIGVAPPVCQCTAQRMMHYMGLPNRRPAKVKKFTPLHRLLHHIWAGRHCSWIVKS